MRTMFILSCAIFASVSLVFGSPADRYVIPRQDGVGVYPEAVRPAFCQATFQVGTEMRLRVIGQQGDAFQISTVDGRTGWVEKRLVVSVGRMTRMEFAGSDVLGYLDTPEPVCVFDVDDGVDHPILLDRSFRENLSQNIDRETAERSHM